MEMRRGNSFASFAKEKVHNASIKCLSRLYVFEVWQVLVYGQTVRNTYGCMDACSCKRGYTHVTYIAFTECVSIYTCMLVHITYQFIRPSYGRVSDCSTKRYACGDKNSVLTSNLLDQIGCTKRNTQMSVCRSLDNVGFKVRLHMCRCVVFVCDTPRNLQYLTTARFLCLSECALAVRASIARGPLERLRCAAFQLYKYARAEASQQV
jgi:hypothetical protein